MEQKNKVADSILHFTKKTNEDSMFSTQATAYETPTINGG